MSKIWYWILDLQRLIMRNTTGSWGWFCKKKIDSLKQTLVIFHFVNDIKNRFGHFSTSWVKGLIDIFKNKICPFHINHFDSFKNISKMNNVKVFQKQYKNSIFNLILSASNPRTGQTKSNNSSTTCNELLIAPSVVGTPLFWENPNPLFWVPPSFWIKFKKLPSTF